MLGEGEGDGEGEGGRVLGEGEGGRDCSLSFFFWNGVRRRSGGGVLRVEGGVLVLMVVVESVQCVRCGAG